jgi:DNA replication protein DnaC
VKRKRDNEEDLQKAKEYFEILKKPKIDEVHRSVQVPPTFNTSGARFQIDGEGNVLLIDRKKLYEKLMSFLRDNQGMPALYIQGPQGIGKSHLLLRCVTELRSDFNNRVIYVPGSMLAFVHPYKTIIHFLQTVQLGTERQEVSRQ